MSQTPVRGWPDRVAAGARVFLRPPSRDDLEEFTALIDASLAFLAPWEPWVHGGPEPSAARRLERLLALRDSRTNLKFLVCRVRDGAILGAMNINNIVRGVFDCAALGYWIGAPYARKGYTGDALQLAMHYAFDGLGLHRLEANIRPENEASIALVRRAGFREEGYSPRMLKIAGVWADHERWAILRDEWTPRDPDVEVRVRD